MGKKRSEDARVRRTRNALRKALLELIPEKGFDSVTIQEIARRAHVGRSTFYAHFRTKADLLLLGFDYWESYALEYLRHGSRAGGPPAERGFRFSPLLLEHMHLHGHLLYRAMFGPKGSVMLQARLRQSLTTLLREEFGKLGTARSHVSFEAMVQFVVGGFLGMMGWWLDHAPHLSPKEMDKLFRKLAAPAVEAALGRKL